MHGPAIVLYKYLVSRGVLKTSSQVGAELLTAYFAQSTRKDNLGAIWLAMFMSSIAVEVGDLEAENYSTKFQKDRSADIVIL